MKRILTIVINIWLLLFTHVSMATGMKENLLSVYQQALNNDPILAQAKADAMANKEAVPQSESALLPSLNGSANTTSVYFNQPDLNISGQTNRHAYQLSLTQPVFNLQNWWQFKVTKAVAKKADATYQASLQGLMIRVSQAYFNVLQAKDTLQFIHAQKIAVARQLKQIHSRYQVGMVAMTDVYQAQASYDALTAQEINAENNVLNAIQALSAITNKTYDSRFLATLKENMPALQIPEPKNIQQWCRIAEKNNWTLLATYYATQAAKKAIQTNFAGHFPSVNAVGNYENGNNNISAGRFGNTGTQWQSSVGLEVNLPIYQGGLVLSKTRQAQDQYLSASSQMEFARRQAILSTQQAFNNIVTSVSKIKADKMAILSGESALDSTKAGYQAGTKTILDVLNAEKTLYEAKASLSADQYNGLFNVLLFKQAIGSLNIQDMIRLNHLLQL